jgi:hypothetical protein
MSYGTWVGVGAGVGAAIGAATHHLAAGLGFGSLWGLAIVFIARRGWLG